MKKRAHSAYWIGNDVYDDITDARGKDIFNNPEWLLKLSTIRKAVANFVQIMTGKDIPVIYSSGDQSYSVDMQQTQETDKEDYIVISANDDPEYFDVNVGIALHEAAHLILTKKTDIPESTPCFKAIRIFSNFPSSFIPPLAPSKNCTLSSPEIVRLTKLLMNVLEDRRIDRWVYNHSIGYQPYYEALYRAKWNSPEIDKQLLDPSSHVPLYSNYIFRVINVSNPNNDPSVLPGLTEIFNLIDLPNISRLDNDLKWDVISKFENVSTPKIIIPFDQLPDMFQIAFKIIEIISKHAYKPEQLVQTQFTAPPEEPDPLKDPNMDISEETSSVQEVPDLQGMSTNEINKLDDTLRHIIDKQRDFLSGMYGNVPLDKEISPQLNIIDHANTSIVSTGDSAVGHTKVLIYRNFSKELLESSIFTFSQTFDNHAQKSMAMQEAVTLGLNKGNILADQLKILADEHHIRFIHQRDGHINKRALAGLGYDNDTIFYHNVIERHNPIFVHLSLDASSSMVEHGSKKWSRAITLATALAQAADKLPTLDVVISLRGSLQLSIACVVLLYDSRVDNLTKIKQLFPYLRANGSTPEGLCFNVIRDEIIKSVLPTTRKFFINISDGAPSFATRPENNTTDQHLSYGGRAAWNHTAKQVHLFRENNINVLSYFVSDEKIDNSYFVSVSGDHASFEEQCYTGFKVMYGPDARYINVEQIYSIARTLNQLFLQE